MKAYSLFQSAIREEIKDIIDEETQIVSESKNSYGDDNGNLYFPLISDDILTNDNAIFSISGSVSCNDYHNKHYLSNRLNDEIKRLKYDITKGFDVMKFLANAHTVKSIYGMLVKSDDNTDYLINPLHPLTALAIKLGQIEIPKKGTIIIYEYADSIINSGLLDNAYNQHIEKTWVEYIKQSSNFINTEIVQRRLANTNQEHYFNELEYLNTLDQVRNFGKLEFIEDSVNSIKPKALMVPLQVMVDSIATPFYGMTLLKDPTNENSYGLNVGGFRSGNIDMQRSGFSSVGEDRGNICTGSASKTRPSGWLTLNRVYLSSMWYDNIIPNEEELVQLATTSKKIACGFYKISDNAEETESNDSDTSSSNSDNDGAW